MSTKSQSGQKSSSPLQFIQAFIDFEPIYNNTHIPYISDESNIVDYSHKIISTHSTLLQHLTDVFFDQKINPKIEASNTVRVSKQRLSRQLYKLIAVYIDQHGIDSLDGGLEAKIDLLISPLADLPSQTVLFFDKPKDKDPLASLKTTLLARSLEFDGYLSTLVDQQTAKHLIKWFNEYAVALARDIAVSWNEHPTKADKSQIFLSILPYCCSSIMNSWFYVVFHHPETQSAETFWGNAVELEAAISTYHLGWGFQASNLNALKRNIYKTVTTIANTFSKNTRYPIDTKTVRNGTKKHLQKPITHAWHQFHEHYIKQVDDLNPDHYRVWRLTEGERPVPYELFEDYLRNNLLYSNLVQLNEKTYQTIELRAKAILATLWGISNAYCKVTRAS